jgi:hypothetical protein
MEHNPASKIFEASILVESNFIISVSPNPIQAVNAIA